MMNLIQISDAIQNLPLDTVMKYANGENPQVPSYLALGELNRRKMLEDAAKGAAASAPPTVKSEIENSLLQQRPMASPVAAQPMVNPAAAQPMVNPAAAPAMANPAAARPMVNMGIAPAAPEAMPTANMADGGVTTLMPTGGFQGYPEDGEDPGDYPQRSSPLQMADGGLTAIPMHGMFKAGSYAGGGIVAFENNEDQPVSLDMPANNTPSANVDSADEIFRRLVAAQTESNANPPVPIAGSETAGATTSDVNPAVTPPAAAPKATAPSSVFMPSIEKPETKTEEQITAERAARMKRFGVSEDPLAESKAVQAKNYERQQAEVAQQPFDRLISSLAAVAKADPTKGIGAIGAAYGEKSQEVAGLQRAYKDKIEEANLQYKTAVAKEEDARKRGDMKGVEEALAAQQKAQFEYGKYMNDFQNTISSRITAGAAASNAANQAALLPYMQKNYEASAKHHEMTGQAAIVNANANLIGKIEGQGNKEDQLTIRADNALSNRPEFKKAAKAIEDMPIGSPGYNAYNQYISDLRREEVSALRENRQPRYIEPPKITPEVKTLNPFKANTPERAEYKPPAPLPGGGRTPKNDILPMPATKADAIPGKKYNLPDGTVGVWNGFDFLVLPK